MAGQFNKGVARDARSGDIPVWDAKMNEWIPATPGGPKALSLIGIPIGGFLEFAANATPPAPGLWASCVGTSVPTTGTFAKLFAVIGYYYGGAGASFNIPDFRDRVSVGSGGSFATPTGGASTVTLGIGEIPSHNHGVTDPGHVHGTVYANAAGGSIGQNVIPPWNPAAAGSGAVSSAVTGISIQNNGSGGAHNNVQPYALVSKWIRYG